MSQTKSSVVSKDRMACTGKGKLWKDLVMGRYQTLMRVETKNGLSRTFIIEQIEQGCTTLPLGPQLSLESFPVLFSTINNKDLSNCMVK